jgi:hypothetical protein
MDNSANPQFSPQQWNLFFTLLKIQRKHSYVYPTPPGTQQQCDDLVVLLRRQTCQPRADNSGSSNYAVTAGGATPPPTQHPPIFERETTSDCDTTTLDLARQIHGELVRSPAYFFMARIGQSYRWQSGIIDRQVDYPGSFFFFFFFLILRHGIYSTLP